ncbi:MAG: polysaccharide biosynthesis/export family protein [Myxococcota bacterium]
MKRNVAWGGVAAVLVLVGCATQKKTLPPVKDEPFRIGREDVLEITVWRDADLSRIVGVRPDGFVSLPLLGELQVEGKTPAALAAEIKEALRPYVQEPKVTVTVREVRSTRVFVTGEVARPGGYPIHGPISVLQAVTLAGGFSDFADREGMLVIRAGKDGGAFPVRYSELVSAEGDAAEARLLPGDTVVVP